jgi:glycosyltransferase involved in cell wall biosynthesis
MAPVTGTEGTRERWHLITGEYPPDIGGVADHTRLLAQGLSAAGAEVHVWTGRRRALADESARIRVHRSLGAFGLADLYTAGAQIDRHPAPRRIVVQWVPHGYGWRSLNLPFAFWLWRRAARGDAIELIVHEPYVGFGGTWRRTFAAAVHRLMTIAVLRAAARVWMSIPLWESRLRPYALGRPIPMMWLPVPSNIPVSGDPRATAAIRRHVAAGGGPIVGHFGTYGEVIAGSLEAVVVPLLRRNPTLAMLLIGKDGDRFAARLITKHPTLAERLHATGVLDQTEVSHHLSACDVMVQPYPDGVSSRRGTVMASLAHGLAIVTTAGPPTEECWSQTGAVQLVERGRWNEVVRETERLLADVARREQLQIAALALYADRFDISRAIARLRGDDATAVATAGLRTA